jgi:hypothetical protein
MYDVHVEVTGYRPQKERAVTHSAITAWPGNPELHHEVAHSTILVRGRMEIPGFKHPIRVADAITHAIWRANKAFCRVLVGVTYIENAPYDAFELEKCDYDQWLEHEEE